MFFSKISGFDVESLRKIPTANSATIELLSAWGSASIFLMSLTAYYFAFITTSNLLIEFFALFFSFSVVYSISVLLTSNKFEFIAEQPNILNIKVIHRFNIIIYLLIAFIFSQPALIFVCHKFYSKEVISLNENERNIRLQNFNLEAQNIIDNKAREISLINERMVQMGAGDSLVDSAVNPNSDRSNTLKDSINLNDLKSTRKALIFGNQNYRTSPLNNTVKDASDIAKSLKKIGFNYVIEKHDLTRIEMEYAIYEYLNSLKPGDISFFFYSGHGVEKNGIDYLIPIDYDGTINTLLPINATIERFSNKSLGVSVFAIDACRARPFASDETGVNKLEAGTNTYAALSSRPGQYSYDGPPGTNSLFTKSLIKHIGDSEDIDIVFRRTRVDVENESKGKQMPISWNNLLGKFTLSIPNKPSLDPVNNSKTAKSSQASCSNFDVNELNNYSDLACLRVQYQKQSDDLAVLKSDKDTRFKEMSSALDSKFADDKFNPVLFYRFIWSGKKKVIASLVITAILMIVLSGGFLIRELLSDILFLYRSYKNTTEMKILNVYYGEFYEKLGIKFDEFKQKLKTKLNRNSHYPFNQLHNFSYTPHLISPFSIDQDMRDRTLSSEFSGDEAYKILIKSLKS